MAAIVLRGMLREMFCGELNFFREDSFKGKIILLDLPVKDYCKLPLK